MTFGLRFRSVLLLLGLAWGAHAEPGPDSAQNGKPSRFSINLIKQPDGSVIERLDLSALGVGREAGIPGTPAEWLLRIVAMTRNGVVKNRPQLFAEWLDTITEPRSMTALATVAVEPSAFPRTLSRLPDPAAASKWAELVDPEVFMRWVAAGMDPNLYQAVFQHMFDPKKYLRWAADSGHPLTAGVHATESNNNARVVENRAGNPATTLQEGARAWIQLPTRAPRANPWLASGNTSRY
jgi:hypothetical protein